MVCSVLQYVCVAIQRVIYIIMLSVNDLGQMVASYIRRPFGLKCVVRLGCAFELAWTEHRREERESKI